MEPKCPTILYDDKQLLVCVKPVGVLSEAADGKGMPDLLSQLCGQNGKPGFVSGVHRLDRNVGGLMVFSRRKDCTGKLISQVAEHRMIKEYVAVLRGALPEPDGILEDLLFRDSSKNKTYVVKRMRKGVRDAKLSYHKLAEVTRNGQILTLVQVRLHTGRTHQIRVQFSSRQLPLLGDIRYGSKDPDCDIALWATRLRLHHPTTNAPLTFQQLPPEQYPWNLFDPAAYQLTELP